MKVKNISNRLHHVGGAMCIPGEVTEIGDEWAGQFNSTELEVVEPPVENDAISKPKNKSNTKEAVDNPFALSK